MLHCIPKFETIRPLFDHVLRFSCRIPQRLTNTLSNVAAFRKVQFTQSKRWHIVIDSLPEALWRMVGLVHDPHIGKLVLTIGILA